MFSVIIPLYNKSAYIEKCLQSVLFQSFRCFEIIIVNDGSSDGGAEKVNEFILKGNRNPFFLNNSDELNLDNLDIKLVNQPNYGVSVARNIGVELAKYNYLAFLDADDWWEASFLEGMKSLIESYPEAAFYASDFYYHKDGQNIIKDKGLPYEFISGYIDYVKVFSSRFIPPVNCSFAIVRKDIFLTYGGFNPDLKVGEDFELWLRLALNYKLAYLNKPIAYSNQDADKTNRAISKDKKWKPTEHFIYNLGIFSEQEKSNPELKKLLDGLRLRNLINNRLNGWNKPETQKILSQVNFKLQPAFFRIIYHSPVFFSKLLIKMRSAVNYLQREISLKFNICFF